LASLDLELGHQDLFYRLGMLSCFSEPGQNRIFFEPFDSGQGADAIPFGQQGQGLQDFMLGCPLAEEDRPGRFGKGLLARLASIALNTLLGLAEFDDVLLSLTILKLSTAQTSFVWTEISGLGKLFHRSPSVWFAPVYIIQQQHPKGRLPGPERRLNSEQEAELKAKAERGEIRTIQDGVEWAKTHDVAYTYWGMRWVFDRLDLKKKVPRPKSPKASAEEQEAWKKGG
jgi:hypothetical protein